MTTFSLRRPRRAMIAAALTLGTIAAGVTPALARAENPAHMGAVASISQKYTMFLPGEFDATKNELAIETLE